MAIFRIFRFPRPKDKTSYFDTYEIPIEKGMTVLEALYYIMETQDPTLAFRSSCRAAVCGSCAMHINGKYRLACQTQVSDIGKVITIRPLAHLPLIKDLIVDMTVFFKNLELIKPYLINEGPFPEKEFIQSPTDRKRLDLLIDCILCGACYASCPVVGTDESYLGPHVFLKALRFIADTRDKDTNERFAVLCDKDGVYRCHTIFNCQIVCPKDLDPSQSIAKLKLKGFRYILKF